MGNRPRDKDTVPLSPYPDTIASTPVTPGEAPDEVPYEGRLLPSPNERYITLERLGEGGMGEVLLCRDERLGRKVALKRIHASIAQSADLRARFLREARVQGRIEHPSIVPVYDLDVASGAPFFTMRRVQGATLGEILARIRDGEDGAAGTYSRPKLLAAFARACLAVDLAHAHGVVHRDLKPDNIMLGFHGELYVLDWGIAKIAGEKGGDAAPPRADVRPLHTRAGASLGTPGYMAPEQLDAVADVDARADVYGLGAILFEIIALQPLHAIEDPALMARATRAGVEARPSVRVPGCDSAPELDAICARATAPAREERYESARALYDAIERFREKDRDLEQRRAQAAEHAGAAEEACKDAASEIDPTAPRRVRALREASLALALDPTHTGAFEVIRQLLANPPRMLPPEVDRDLDQATTKRLRAASRGGALLLLTWFAYLPLAVVVGIRNVALYTGVSVLFALAALVSYIASLRPPASGRLPVIAMLVVAAPLAAASAVWSPIILVPPLAMTFGAGMIIVTRTRAWPVAEAATACALVAAPVVLSLSGVVAPFFAFEGGRMLILPVMLSLPPTLTLGVITVTFILIVGSVFAWSVYLKTALSKAERTLQLYAWHLRQLLAHESARARGTPPPPSAHDRPSDFRVTTVETGPGRVGLDDPLDDLQAGFTRYERIGDVPAPGEGHVLLFEDRRVGRSVAMRRTVPGDRAHPGAPFEVEIHVRARLEHPAIPPLYDVGTDEGGGRYFTTRRPRGTTLADAIASGRVSLHKLVEALATACQAVDYAHAQRVVHRSLRPDRIVLGDYGEVYVTGWGTACRAEADAAGLELAAADVAALRQVLGSILDAAHAAFENEGERGKILPEGACVPPELEAIRSISDAYASAKDLHVAATRFLEGERDAVQRRARAAEYVAIAETAMEGAFAATDGGAEERAAAMRAVSHSLALDSSNRRASNVLMKLLTVPPRRLPAEAVREIEESGRANRGRSALIAAVLYLTWFVYAPFVLATPGASAPLVAVVSVLFAAAAAAFWRVARGGPVPDRGYVSPLVFSMLAAAALGVASGPLVLVPAMAVGNVIGFVLQRGPYRRGLVLVLACLSFAAPITLQILGAIPPSYVAQGDALAIVPQLVPQPSYTPAVLTLVHVMLVFSACVFFRRFRDARNRAEEKLHLHAWQLRHLVPIEAPLPEH